MAGPMAQFGRYIGNGDIEDSQLSQDGSSWGPGNAAKWNFVCIGNGTAVQDFWLPKDGNVGTNLRTRNAGAGRIGEWLRGFESPRSVEKWSDAFASPVGMAELHNTKQFLRALSDQLAGIDLDPAIAEPLDTLVNGLTRLI